MILVHQVDPGWYDRYWYSNHSPDPVRLLTRGVFCRVMRWAWTIQAGPQVGEFKFWHSPLGHNPLGHSSLGHNSLEPGHD